MRKRRNHKIKAEMNVVPFIDVMLVLLVIFMIAAPLIQQSVKIDLPKAEQEIQELTESADLTLPLILSVNQAGQLFLNVSEQPEEPLSQNEIISQVQTYLVEHPNIDVYVRGDANASYANVMEGLTILNKAGASNVSLSTQPPDAP